MILDWINQFYLSLIPNDSVTHRHGFAVSVKEGLPFAHDLRSLRLFSWVSWRYLPSTDISCRPQFRRFLPSFLCCYVFSKWNNIFIYFSLFRSYSFLSLSFPVYYFPCLLLSIFLLYLCQLKILGFLLMFLTGFTLFSIFLLLSPLIIILFFVHIFKAVSFNIVMFFLIIPSVNLFVFKDSNVHLKEKLTCSAENDRLVNSAIIFLSQTTLFRLLTSLLGQSLTVMLTVLLY